MATTMQTLESLRTKDAKALRAELADLQSQLQKARVDIGFGRTTKTSMLPELRKQAARIQTILKEQEASNA
jgi:ribosomal protein L29